MYFYSIVFITEIRVDISNKTTIPKKLCNENDSSLIHK